MLIQQVLPMVQNFVRSTEFYSRVAVIYGAYKVTQLKATLMRLKGSSSEPRVKVSTPACVAMHSTAVCGCGAVEVRGGRLRQRTAAHARFS